MGDLIHRLLKTETRRLGKPAVSVGNIVYVREPHAVNIVDQSIEVSFCVGSLFEWRSLYYKKHLPLTTLQKLAARKTLNTGRMVSGRFMPAALARTKIEIASIHRERLKAITDAGAKAEGFSSRAEFLAYWDLLHPEKPARKNPFVYVIKFDVV